MKLRDGGTMFLLIALFVGFIFAENADAGEWQITIGSYHTGPDDIELRKEQMLERLPEGHDVISYGTGSMNRWTEINPGIVYSTGKYYAGVIAQNSQGATSVVAGRQWKVSNSIDLSAGVATGYKGSAILPVFGAHYTAKNFRVSALPYTTKSKPFNVGEVDPFSGESKTSFTVESERTYGIAFAFSLVF